MPKAHKRERPNLVLLSGSARDRNVAGSAAPVGPDSTLLGGAPPGSAAAVRTSELQRPTLSDEDVIEAVRQGDRTSADELYFRLVDAVDITLFRIFGRRETDHEDLVQRAFEQIVLTLSRRTFAGACSLRTWASAVTARVAFNVLRSRRRERAILVSAPPDQIDHSSGGPDAEALSAAREDIARLRLHLTKMKPDRAQAVFLHDVLGHELAEIAVMEDISIAAAQSRLVRGRKDLYKRLGIEGAKETRATWRPL